MDQLSAVRTVLAKAWLMDENRTDYWVEGEPSELEVERTDDDEIRLGIRLRGAVETDDGTLYLSRSEAIRLVLALAAAVGDR